MNTVDEQSNERHETVGDLTGVDAEVRELAGRISARIRAGEVAEATMGVIRDLYAEVAGKHPEEYEAGFVAGAVRIAEAVGEPLSRAFTLGREVELRAQRRKVGDQSAVAYARGLVEGGLIGSGIDPGTGERFDDPDVPSWRQRVERLEAQVKDLRTIASVFAAEAGELS
ncbi:MAG TPA: hypothetical protein VF062_15435 [Candidatus Limnocylindrales bacterium]